MLPSIHQATPSLAALDCASSACSIAATDEERAAIRKPDTRPNRRMGVALARDVTPEAARERALRAAARVSIRYR